MPSSLEGIVGGSGKMFHVVARDGSNVLSNITEFNTNSSQLIHIHGAAGTWTATLSGHGTTSAIAVGALAATVLAALEALSGVGSGQVTVTGDGPTRLVGWTGTLGGTVVPLLTFGTGSLSGTGSAPPTTAGSTAEDVTDATLGASFAVLGTWTGSAASRVTTSGGDGRKQAEWTITGLTAGTYQIFSGQVTSGAGNSDEVPFRFFDGTTPRGLVQVNQQSQANTVAFPDGGGTSFQAVATVAITGSNSLRVLITDESVEVGKQIEAAKIAVVPIDFTAPIIFTLPLNAEYVSRTGTWHLNDSKTGAWNGAQNYTQIPGDTFTWTFPGLLPGTYSVQIQSLFSAGWDTASSYQVFCDGAPSGSPTIVDQTVAPTPGSGGNLTLTDSQPEEQTFLNLGSSFTTTTGNISVTMTSSAGTGSGPIFGSNATAALISLQSASGYAETVSATGEVFAGGPPSIRVNGGSPILLGTPNFDPAGGQPIMMFPLVDAVDSDDTVTFTCPANAVACVAGTIPGITDQAVANHTGGSVGPAIPGNRTMRVGWNTLSSGIVPYSSNLFLTKQPLPFPDAKPGTSLGYPQDTIANVYYLIFGGEPANPVDAKTYPGLLEGLYRTSWDGATGGEIRPVPSAGTTMEFVSLDTGHATGNTVEFNLSIADPETYYAPSLITYFFLNQGFLDDADTGRCSSTGTWTSGSGSTAWNGGYHLSDVSPSSVWTWTLGQLPAGTYAFAALWRAIAGNTTQARYTVKEGGVELTHFDVDQTVDSAASSNLSGSDLNGRIFDAFRPNNESFVATGGLITVDLHTVNGDGKCYADAIGFKLTGSLVSVTPFQPIANAELLGPEASSLEDVPEINPLFTAAFGNANLMRAMRQQSAIYGAFAEIEDYAQEGQLTYQCNNARSFRYNIIKVENDTNSDGFWLRTTDTVNGPYDGSVLVTLAPINDAPLPIIDRTPFLFPNMTNPVYSISGGEFNMFINQIVHHTDDMDDDQISVGNHLAGNYGLGGDTLTTLNITPGDAIGIQDFTSIPRAVYYRHVASIPDCAAWINPTFTWSDACIQAECAIYLSIMPVGSTLIWEPGNEGWNFRFPPYWGLGAYARINSLANGTIANAAIGAHQHAVATTALGARSGELVRAFGCTAVDPGSYTSLLSYCAGIGAPVDLILISNYVNIQPQQIAGLDSLYAGLTSTQLVDCGDATLQLGGLAAGYFAAVQAACEDASTEGHTVHWGIYEAQTTFAMGGTLLQQQTQAYAAIFDPLEYICKQANFALAQQYGATVFAIYSFDEQPFSEFANAIYGGYHAVNATNGIGDGSDGLHDNRPDIAGAPPDIPDLRLVVYPMGAAVQAWNDSSSRSSPFWSRIFTSPVFYAGVGD